MAPRPPEPGEVHVWRVELPPRSAQAAARGAAAELLAAYLGGPERARTKVEEDGKPQLAEAPERLSFNLSHSTGLALIAIAPGGVKVGVDVERLRPRRDLPRLAARWLPAADAAAVSAASAAQRTAVFYAAWTRHEARVKCTGVGLAGPPPGEEVRAWNVEVGAGYAAAVALCGDGVPAREPRIALREAP